MNPEPYKVKAILRHRRPGSICRRSGPTRQILQFGFPISDTLIAAARRSRSFRDLMAPSLASWLVSANAWSLAVFAFVYGVFYGGWIAALPAVVMDDSATSAALSEFSTPVSPSAP